MHSNRNRHPFKFTVFTFMCLLVLCFMPGITASAATKTYSVDCTGGTINYGNSQALSISASYSNNVLSVSGKPGSFKITIEPNTSTSSRVLTIYSTKNAGKTVVDELKITQAGVPTKTINAACVGGNKYYANSKGYSYSYSNTAVCEKRSGNNFVVKPNKTTTSRSCKVNVKNSAGKVIAYVNIYQSGVPVKTISASGSYTSFKYSKAGATTLTPKNQNMIYKVNKNSSGEFACYVSANPSNSSTRSSEIVVKNSRGVYLEIIKVSQAKFSPTTDNHTYSSDPRTLTYTCANADPSKTVVSDSSVLSCTSIGDNKFQVKLKQNPLTTLRKCTISFKDKFGTVIQKHVITQKGVPVKTISASGGYTSFKYSKAGATTLTPRNKNMIYKVNKNSSGEFACYVSANPSNSSTRSSEIVVKNSKGVYLEIIKVSQAPYTPKIYNSTYDCDQATTIYTCLNADPNKTVVSNSSMLSWYYLEGNKFEFKIKKNTSTALRKCTISFKDKFGTVIQKRVITQKGKPMLKINDYGYDSFTFRANGDYMGGQTDVLQVRDKNHVYLCLYFETNMDWKLESSSDWVLMGEASAYVDETKSIGYTSYSPRSIKGSAGKHYIYIRTKEDYQRTSSRSCTIKLVTEEITKTYSIGQRYVDVVNGVPKNQHIKNVQGQKWYKHLSDAAKPYFYGKKLTNGIKYFQSSSVEDQDTYYAVDTYFADDGSVECNYIFFTISLSTFNNAQKKGINITVLNCRDMDISSGAGSPLLHVDGSLRIADMDIDCCDLVAAQRKAKLNLGSSVLSAIFGLIPDEYVVYMTDGVMYAAELIGDAYIKKHDNSDKVNVENIDNLTISMEKHTVLNDKESELRLYYYYDKNTRNTLKFCFNINSVRYANNKVGNTITFTETLYN